MLEYLPRTKNMKNYRNTGASGALLDEYEKAITELKDVIGKIPSGKLNYVIDPDTHDPNCKSFQTILSHVVSAGYNYATEVRRSLGEQVDYKERIPLNSTGEYLVEIDKMFQYNEKLFNDYPDLVLEEHNNEKKILVRWGQFYDVEQLFEHAIVHILRHRRQIERFLIKIK